MQESRQLTASIQEEISNFSAAFEKLVEQERNDTDRTWNNHMNNIAHINGLQASENDNLQVFDVRRSNCTTGRTAW
jgi:hypothetical protein